MPTPIEICLEDLDLSPEDERYMRCVALPDADPGLTLDADGRVVWMPEAPDTTGLWVSGDDQLVLIRPETAACIEVDRSGRILNVPSGKPVVLLHEDLLTIGQRRLRVHIHGPTEDVFAPEPVPASAFRRLAQSAAAALAIGAAAVTGAASAGAAPGMYEKPPIEVRQRPPVVEPMPQPRPLDCKVVSVKATKTGHVVAAQCPIVTNRIFKGLRGVLYGKNKKPLKNGTVVVKSVDKKKVVAVAKSKPKGKPVFVRYMIRR